MANSADPSLPSSPWLKAVPWVLRVVWVSLPFAAGPLFAGALDATSTPVMRTASIGLWGLWVVGVACTAVPHPITLTAFRILAPASLAGAIWAAVAEGASAAAAFGLSATAAVTMLSLLPEVGAWFANGSSYGDERRVPLRPPGPLLLGPLPIAWALVVAGVVAGPMLLAAEQWIAGSAALVVGLPVAFFMVRALHALARRWLVFVPAGVVVHDHLTVADPVLFKRNAVAHLGPALADTDATDLTMGALGLALEIAVERPVTVAVRSGRAPTSETVELTALLVSVSRPGDVLGEARRRRIAVG
ncbi:MAG: hypothetical protein ACE367_00825 [Acidimicrobiales bacterium]